MARLMQFATYSLTCALLGMPVSADDGAKKLTPEERKGLEAQRKALNSEGGKAFQAGKHDAAVKLFQKELEAGRKLYSKAEYPDGHESFIWTLNELGDALRGQNKLGEAETAFREALEMSRRLQLGDHRAVVQSLTNLGGLLWFQGRPAEAEPLFHEALVILRRLVKGDHQVIAVSISNLATIRREQGKHAEAEPLFREALEMARRLFPDQDNQALLGCLSNLGLVLNIQGKQTEAEPLFHEALEMARRVFKGDHPVVAACLRQMSVLRHNQGRLADSERFIRESLAMSERLYSGDNRELAKGMNSLAVVLLDRGNLPEAEKLFRSTLAMRRRISPRDHPAVAVSLSNLAITLNLQEKWEEAEPVFLEALGMYRRLMTTYAAQRAEGESLTLLTSLPATGDGYLTNARQKKSSPAAVYAEVWARKGLVARVYEYRQLSARAAATDPKAAKLLVELADARRRRAELLLAPTARDPDTRTRREEDFRKLDANVASLDVAVRPLLPAVARAEKLSNATPVEVQAALPVDTAIVDFFSYTLLEQDKLKPGEAGRTLTWRYLAFVVTRDAVAWIDLDTADQIERAVFAWREAITGGKDIPAALPAKVRELVWDKVRKELPAGIRTVCLSPDAALCRVPWPALLGDKPGTILIEDFAVAIIPHAPFLLDKLWPQDPVKNPPSDALVVGGVKYDAERSLSVPGTVASRGDPLVKPSAKVGWPFLPATAAEAAGVTGAGAAKKLPVTAFTRDDATTSAILAALPKAKYAHFATHGFFADPSFRSVFQLDEKDYEQSRRGERIGRAASSPLVMTGLVFAGANNPTTPGRGIVTGEALIDLDLSGLELAVLSACETGLGDVAGGEGTFGLQRAFHLAGTRNVVASLWKVPDESTAALMALFYRNLWGKSLPPIEALRQAQLEVYRNPAKIPDLAKGFRGTFAVVPGSSNTAPVPIDKGGKTHPLFWAAFTLSGLGR